MALELEGMHHVTCVTAHANANLAFYTHVLGMRLVKRTVNQDDVSAYHLFYGDANGSPGSDITFFDWPFAAAKVDGPGTVGCTMLRVTGGDALAWWMGYLSERGVPHNGITDWNGRAVLPFTDPEGQSLALVDDRGHGEGQPWAHTNIPVHFGIRGLGPPIISASMLEPTAIMLRDIMGFREAGTYELAMNGSTPRREVTVFETGAGGASAEVHVMVERGMPRGRVGRGGVHHIAFRTPNEAEHTAWHDRLAASRVGVTPVIDRYYFRSLYFREPGGVLFEIATDGPGFAIDEPLEHVGERLSLPPFLEDRRPEIEAGLVPLEE